MKTTTLKHKITFTPDSGTMCNFAYYPMGGVPL